MNMNVPYSVNMYYFNLFIYFFFLATHTKHKASKYLQNGLVIGSFTYLSWNETKNSPYLFSFKHVLFLLIYLIYFLDLIIFNKNVISGFSSETTDISLMTYERIQ